MLFVHYLANIQHPLLKILIEPNVNLIVFRLKRLKLTELGHLRVMLYRLLYLLVHGFN